MDKATRTHIDNLRSEDRILQNQAFTYILKATDKTVDWAYEAWDEMLAGLRHEDNHVRAISAQVLANLAKSDPKERILKDFDALLAVTKDERFVTARHCLLALCAPLVSSAETPGAGSRMVALASSEIRKIPGYP
jgi:HEAT repeat protein